MESAVQLPQLENNEPQVTHEPRFFAGTRLELHAMHVAAVLPQVVQFTIVALQDTQADKAALGTFPAVVQAVQVESPLVLLTLQVLQSVIFEAQGVHDLKSVAGTLVKSARHSWQSVLKLLAKVSWAQTVQPVMVLAHVSHLLSASSTKLVPQPPVQVVAPLLSVVQPAQFG